MSAAPTTTETAWAAAIVAALQTKFSAECDLIAAYSFRDGGDPLATITGQHALLLRAGDAQMPEETRDLARQPIEIEWTISVAVPTSADDPDLLAMARARRVATLIKGKRGTNPDRGNRWGLGAAVGDPRAPALPEWDDIDLHGYILRPVRWTQTGYFPLED